MPTLSRSKSQAVPLQTVQRALAVLDLFLNERELGIREISRRLSVSPAAAHRLVTTLEGARFLEQDEGSKLYRLGPRVMQLARTVRGGPDLRRMAMPYLTHLQNLTGETVCLHAMRVGYRVCLLQLESAHDLRMIVPVGPLPILYGATDQVFRVFGGTHDFPPPAPGGPPGWDERTPSPPPSQADLDAVRERGWAVSFETRVPGGCGVAAPIWGGSEPLAMTVFGPRERMVAQGIDKIANDLTGAARELSAALVVLDGSDGPPEATATSGVESR